MLFYGIISLFVIYLLTVLTGAVLCLNIFPAEISKAVMVTAYPWFLAGFVAYLSAAGIFVQPRWMQRIVMIIISVAFISCLLYLRTYSLYANSSFSFTLLSLLFLAYSFYATNRFRRGVM